MHLTTFPSGCPVRIGCAAGVLLAAAAAAQPPASKPTDPRTRYNQAQAAMVQKQFGKAVELLEPLYASDPTTLGYGLLLAEAYIQEGQPAKARALLGEIAAHPPGDLEARILLGQMLAKIERWQDVVSILTPVASEHEEYDYEVHHLLAEAYRRLGEMSQAVEHYEDALRARPTSGADHEALAEVHLQSDRYALAARAYLDAERNGVRTARTYFGAARALFAMQNFLGKIQIRQIADGHVGQLLDDGYVLSTVRGQEGVFHVCTLESALYQIQRSIVLDNNSAEARYLRGTIWLRIRRHAQALEDYRAVEDGLPTDQQAEYHANRAEAHLGLEEYEAYLEHTRLAAKAAPDRYAQRMAAAYIEVAERCAQKGDLESYIRYLDSAAKEAPSDPTIHHRLGYAYWEANDRKKAVRHWRIVLELAPEYRDRVRLLDKIEEATAEPTATQPRPDR